MKPLPSNAVATRRTPIYTHESMPASLRQAHRTTPRTWASINVTIGRLRYRTLDTPAEDVILTVDRPGVIQPEERHQVEPLGPTAFYLEFYEVPVDEPPGSRAHAHRDGKATPLAGERESLASQQTSSLRREHVNFLWLLDLLEQQLDAFERAARPDYGLMENIVHYMREYPDRFHHPWEDLLFARLADIDARLAPVVAELKLQHEALAANGTRLLESLRGAVCGALIPRQALVQPGRDYIALFRRHMALEEKRLFPALVTGLSDRDWRRIDRAITRRADPLFGRTVAERYERLYQEISSAPATARDAAHSGGGGPSAPKQPSHSNDQGV